MQDDPNTNDTNPESFEIRTSHLPNENRRRDSNQTLLLGGGLGLGLISLVGAMALYQVCLIEIPTGKMAVLVRMTGKDLQNHDEVAPDEHHKGIQKDVLLEGRHFRNPYTWTWAVLPQTEIPSGKLGVLVRTYGDELPAGEILATKETDKGIVPGVRQPGRYPINPYLYRVIEVAPVTIDAGFQGVVTNLAGKLAENPNQLLSDEGCRGTQKTTLREGTHLINPYEKRVNTVDCRSQRFTLAGDKDFGFPSRDGFWVSLDAVIEFRIDPARVAEVYVIYNEDFNGDEIAAELINKIILPNARSFCRLEGSNTLARDFLGGRSEFQQRFQEELIEQCARSGIQVIQALITRIVPPPQIAAPIQDREIAKQLAKQYQQEILQQESERRRKIQEELVKQKQQIVDAEQEAIRITTAAEREQEVALTKANEKLAVAGLRLDATRDEAAAVLSRGQGDAEVIQFMNVADAAGWRAAVKAFQGNGEEYARYVYLQKMASAYQNMIVNTANSPLMKVFESFSQGETVPSAKK